MSRQKVLLRKTKGTHFDRVALAAAHTVAAMSDDQHTQLGAVLVDPETHNVVVWGYNHIPDGLSKTPDRLERPAKYDYIEHAERDVVMRAARQGVSTEGKTMYMLLIPCVNCARAIIGSGIKEIVVDYEYCMVYRAKTKHWDEEFRKVILGMLGEAGVKLRAVSSKGIHGSLTEAAQNVFTSSAT